MFRIVWVILLSIYFCAAKAQNNLIILSASGTPFYLYINDKKVNDSAQSIVKAQKIMTNTCQVKIQFVNEINFKLNETAYLTQQKLTCHYMEFTYAIENIKGKHKLRFISINNLYTDTLSKYKNIPKQIEKYKIDTQEQLEYKDRIAENYPPPSNCTTAISDSLLNRQVFLLQENHISINRMKDAKWFITHNCLSVDQFEKLLLTFDAELIKESLAEFGYDYVIDKTNFLNLTKAFLYRTEQELLKKFYKKKTK